MNRRVGFWVVLVVSLTLSTALLCNVTRWAWAPRCAFVSWLSENDMSHHRLQAVIRDVFGPIVLFRGGMDAETRYDDSLFDYWGSMETPYRLSLLVIVLWTALCVLVVLWSLDVRRRKRREPTQI